MNNVVFAGSLAALLAGLLAVPAAAAPTPPPVPFQGLEVNESVNRHEVRETFVGHRDTIIFYTFADKGTVMTVQIGNNDTTFPVTTTIHTFKAGTSDEDLGKWVNNQHSDGLFPDVPEPTGSVTLPEKACRVTARESNGKVDRDERGNDYQDYAVKFEVDDFTGKDGVKLKGFTDKAKVWVKAK